MSSDSAYCGGTLLSYSHVLTSANCALEFNNDIEFVRVVLGTNINQGRDGHSYKVRNVTIHELYNGTADTTAENDIAMILVRNLIKKKKSVVLSLCFILARLQCWKLAKHTVLETTKGTNWKLDKSSRGWIRCY